MNLIQRILDSLRPSRSISYPEVLGYLEPGSNGSDHEFTYIGRTLATPISGEEALEELRDEEPEQITYISKYRGYKLKFEYEDRTEVIETVPPYLSKEQIETRELIRREKQDIRNSERYHWT